LIDDYGAPIPDIPRNRREQRQSDDRALENSNRACCGVIHGDRFWRIYLPKVQVLTIAQQAGGTPYDIDAMEFKHEGERCSFDTILRIYILRICDIRDPALHHLATIVRGADTSRHDLSPQCGGLFAISLGLSANFPDDHEMLKHGMVMYDALYTWCRSLQAETHNWPARAVGA